MTTHVPQTPGVPGVCGGGVALPIHHKPEKLFYCNISRFWEISSKNEELVGKLFEVFLIKKSYHPQTSQTPGSPGVCELWVTLPIPHKLPEVQEFPRTSYYSRTVRSQPRVQTVQPSQQVKFIWKNLRTVRT